MSMLHNVQFTNINSVQPFRHFTSTDNSTTTKVYDPVVTKVEGMNVLGMVVFSIFFGVVIGRMQERGRPLAELFETLCEATMTLVQLVIWYEFGLMF